MQGRSRMSEAQLLEDVSIARADLAAGRVTLTPPICTMGEDAHLTQYDVFATIGNSRHLMIGDDPRLLKMPAQPRLADFFRHRLGPVRKLSNRLLIELHMGLQPSLNTICCGGDRYRTHQRAIFRGGPFSR